MNSSLDNMNTTKTKVHADRSEALLRGSVWEVDPSVDLIGDPGPALAEHEEPSAERWRL
ncbi:MAG: hypothetical protein H0U91_04480 [Rubrobacter sp.]|jgi:hypothetical protein|nr:hypothetical protein [Rubrobacter sp.]